MLTWLESQTTSAERIHAGLQGSDGQPGLKAVNETYARLEKEILRRYDTAERLGRAAGNGVRTMRLLREVIRALGAARRVEACVVESGLGMPGRSGKEDHERLVEAAKAVLVFREVLASASTSGEKEATDLGRVTIVRQLRGKVVEDGEEKVRDWARKVVREFNATSLGSPGVAATGTMFREADLAKQRFTSACRVLYLLSPVHLDHQRIREADFEPDLLLRSLQSYVQSAVQSSGAGIARGLATLPQLDRALLEVSSRCQSLVAMERVLEGIAEPEHPLLLHDQGPVEDEDDEEEISRRNLLAPLLHALDTSSLPSYFWRSLANGLGGRVQEILSRGGVSARTLRSNRDKVRDDIRECVLRGSRMPIGIAGGDTIVVGNWEREAAVMVGAVMGALGR